MDARFQALYSRKVVVGNTIAARLVGSELNNIVAGERNHQEAVGHPKYNVLDMETVLGRIRMCPDVRLSAVRPDGTKAANSVAELKELLSLPVANHYFSHWCVFP